MNTSSSPPNLSQLKGFLNTGSTDPIFQSSPAVMRENESFGNAKVIKEPFELLNSILPSVLD